VRWIAEFATASRHLREHPRLALQAGALAFVLTALNVVAVWAVGLGYSAGLDLATVFTCAPVVFLIAMIPISVAGWGLREGAFVLVFGLLGVPAAVCLTVSVTLGIAVLIAYAPAAVLFVVQRRRAREREVSAA
jgi:hypothetical protein